MSNLPPTLNYADPSTPRRVAYAIEVIPSGYRFVGQLQMERRRFGGWIVAGLAGVLAICAVAQFFVRHDDDRVTAMLILLGLAVLLGFGARRDLSRTTQPVQIEVQPDRIEFYDPQQLWGRRRKWATGRIKRIRIIRRLRSVVTPMGDMLIQTTITTEYLIRNVEMAELDDLGKRIEQVTGCSVIRSGPLSWV